MSEFNNRVAAQRQVLQVVNRKAWEQEELFGLSRKAIDRWCGINRINPQSRLVSLIESASSRLFFLANKSQEQVSDEYMATSAEVASITSAIECEISPSR